MVITDLEDAGASSKIERSWRSKPVMILKKSSAKCTISIGVANLPCAVMISLLAVLRPE